MSEPLPFPSPSPEVHEIRRYPNRRLYDATRSKTVTLDELHRLVVGGHQIRVTETATGEDITARILTQIILDLDIAKLEMFPASLLHAVLQVNEKLMREFMDTHFHQALKLFSHSREQFESQWKQNAAPLGGPDWMQGWMTPFLEAAKAPAAPGETEPPLAEVVQDLSRQMADLQKQMAAHRAPESAPDEGNTNFQSEPKRQ